VAAGQDHPRPDSDPLSVLDQAAQHPFTDEEREIIGGVLETAAELKSVEEESIALRMGAYEEIDGRMQVVQTPDPLAAEALLYDPPYLELRAECLTAIDILQGLIETRSEEATTALRDRRRGYSSAATALLVAGLLAVLVLAAASGRGNLQPSDR
jgi:methyl-accepting chemotaxis protein